MRLEIALASPPLTTFEVRQAELTYSATLDPPVFDFPARWVEMETAMYGRFSPYKLRLPDIKVESTSNNPGDLCVACWVFTLGAVVRYRLDRLEIWSNSLKLAADETVVSDFIQQAMDVLRAASSDPHVVLHSLSVALHGVLVGETHAVKLSAYVTRVPQGEPALTPSGVSFFSRLPSGDGRGSIVFESSLIVPEGAFLKVTSEHSGALSEREALAQSADFFRTATRRIGLDVSWGS